MCDRILGLYGEENAVEDTIYYLGEALRKEVIGLDAFLKVLVSAHTISLCLTHTHTHSLSLSHTHTLSLSLSHTHTHTHTQSLSVTHTHTHTLSLSYTHALSLSLSLSFAHTHTPTHTPPISYLLFHCSMLESCLVNNSWLVPLS